jgi:hypothetical protein
MPKINGWLFGFFMAALYPSILMLYAEEPLPGAASSRKAVSSVSEAATPGVGSAVPETQQEVRDPFAMAPLPPEAPKPKPAPEASPKDATNVGELQGIGFGSKAAYAVIGNEIFYVGDTKNGIKLLEVRRREVDISVDGEKSTLHLFPGEALQKARDRARSKRAVGNDSVNQPSKMASSSSGRE